MSKQPENTRKWQNKNYRETYLWNKYDIIYISITTQKVGKQMFLLFKEVSYA